MSTRVKFRTATVLAAGLVVSTFGRVFPAFGRASRWSVGHVVITADAGISPPREPGRNPTQSPPRHPGERRDLPTQHDCENAPKRATGGATTGKSLRFRDVHPAEAEIRKRARTSTLNRRLRLWWRRCGLRVTMVGTFPTEGEVMPLARTRIAAVVLALVGGALTCPATPTAASDATVRPLNGYVVVTGAGWGHGKGMSQYGAYGAADAGLSHEKILAFYYPKTTLSTLKRSR